MSLYQLAGAFGSSVALPFIYQAIRPALTSHVVATSAKVAGSLLSIGLGYAGARAIYQSNTDRLHDYLWLTREWGFNEAKVTIEKAREALTITTVAVSCLPMAYIAFWSK